MAAGGVGRGGGGEVFVVAVEDVDGGDLHVGEAHAPRALLLLHGDRFLLRLRVRRRFFRRHFQGFSDEIDRLYGLSVVWIPH